MNVKLLEQVRDEILREPRKLNMSRWFVAVPGVSLDYKEMEPPCGTVGCIAGWTVALAAPEDRGTLLQHGGFGFDIWTIGRARELLEISPTQVEALFHTKEWPMEFRRQYEPLAGTTPDTLENAQTKQAQLARITAERIDYFIAKGE